MSKKLAGDLRIGLSQAQALEKSLSRLRQGEVVDLTALLGGGVYDIKGVGSRLAMFVNGQPVDEPTYVNSVMEAYDAGKTPLEMGIYMQELRDLERTDPERYNAWKASGFKETKFSGGANTEVNRIIAARGGLSKSNYDRIVQDFQDKSKLAYIRTPYNGDAQSTFQQGVRGWHENVERIDSPSPITFAVHVTQPDGVSVVLQGRVRSNTSQEIFFADANGQPYTVIEEKQILGDVAQSIAAEGDVGHVTAESTQQIKKTIDRIEYLINQEEAAGQTNSVKYLKALLESVQHVYIAARANDKIFFQTPFPTGSQRLREAYALVLEQAAALGHNQILLVKETGEGRFQGETLTVPFGYEVGVGVSEYRTPNQAWKGSRSRVLLGNLRKLLEGTAEADLAAQMFEEGSSSPLAMALMRTLSRLFDDPTFMKAIRKRKKTKTKARVKTNKRDKLDTGKINRRKKAAEKAIERNAKELRRQVKSQPITFVRMGFNRGRETDLVALLNMDIEQAVIEQMNLPSLQNRTGRFASSVRITSAEQRAIMYTYRKAPYSVFSMTQGRRPWATRDRDPDTIITNAVKSLALGKYASYFANPQIRGA
jgi:hypothetical protein